MCFLQDVPSSRSDLWWSSVSQIDALSSLVTGVTDLVDILRDMVFYQLLENSWGCGSAGRVCLSGMHQVLGSVPRNTQTRCGSGTPVIPEFLRWRQEDQKFNTVS